jgi:uncharacterized membrane protein
MLYQIAVFVHILAAITWVGGTLFLVMVMVPLTRRQLEPSLGARLLGQTGRRFRPVAWTSIILLALTGLYIAADHWGIGVKEFFGGDGWFIRVLQAKVGLFIAIIALSAIHDFVLGPRVTRQLEALSQTGHPPPSLQRARRTLVWLARVSLLLVLVVLALAVTLIRGSPFV